MAAKTICQENEIVEKGRKGKKEDCVHLPDEIIQNIMLRLPAIDVLNFLAVCQSWSSLLSEPDFITAHFHRSDFHKEVEEILFTTVEKPTSYSDKYQYNNFSLNPLDLKAPPADKKFHNKPKTLFLQSSCRGFLLFQDRYSPENLYISNPILKYCLAVPRTPHYVYSQWTLVYDSLTNVFKVVGFYFNSMDIFTDALYWQSYLNVIGSDYYNCEVLSQFFCMGEELHWLTIDLDNSSGKECYYIFSMHISTETFTKTRVPECKALFDKNSVDSSILKGMHLLTDLNGYLCLTIVSDDQLHILLLLDKTESRWSKTHVIHLPSLYNYPNLTLSSFIYDDICIIALKSDIKDDLLGIFKILIHQDDQVYYYDLKTDELKPIGHLSKDQKLCRSYMFHSNRFAFV